MGFYGVSLFRLTIQVRRDTPPFTAGTRGKPMTIEQLSKNDEKVLNGNFTSAELRKKADRMDYEPCRRYYLAQAELAEQREAREWLNMAVRELSAESGACSAIC